MELHWEIHWREKGREAKYSEVSLEQNPGQNLKRNLTENSEQPPNPEGPHGCNSISIKLYNQVFPIPIILRLQFECSKCVMYYEWVKPMP